MPGANPSDALSNDAAAPANATRAPTRSAPQIILRPLTLNEAPRIARLTADWALARLTEDLPFPAPPVAAEGRILIAHARAPLDQERDLGVELQGEGLIGTMTARRRRGGIEIAGWLGRAYWGRGLGAKALEAITALAARLWEGPLLAVCPEESVAGLRALAALGFTDAGGVEERYSLARLAPMRCRRLEWAPRAVKRRQETRARQNPIA